ncbi:hypothetical protein BXZ70DRAFT_981477 [Cristinia sonorae]|uniref:Mitochondrial import inner membrane translocase subunit TIM16 n=1 Tax=Cristinia sonorae TaxID=1940300 RepID=A0A8K0XUR7_9AGAR|nr:hypothetical protein BXZ70DRAFT_981477 [Cristinia sonorae]
MSLPKLIVQITIAGAQIFGKAFLAAGRQAVQNAKHRPDAIGGADVAGIRNATSGSLTDKLTREHRMTLDEAHLILNTKKEATLEQVIQHYEHLFKANSPPTVHPAAAPKARAGGKQPPPPAHSHYLQSKVVRARERIAAELEIAQAEQPPLSNTSSSPPPPSEGGKSN